MITYALSAPSAFSDLVTESAAALRESKFRNFEISFSKYTLDDVDETHWIPGQGIHDWPEIMRRIRAIDHDVLLILETTRQLSHAKREIDPLFALRQNERACWFLENCERLVPEIEDFRIPGN